MKILLIITQSSWGGAQKYVHTLAVNLAKNDGMEIVVAGGAESIGELVSRLKTDKVKFIPLNHLVRRIHPFHDILAVMEIKHIIGAEQPDIVHLNSSKAGAVGSLAAKLSRHRAKVIYTVHGWVFNENLNPLVKLSYYLIEKLLGWCKDYFICLTELDRRTGIEAKIAPPSRFIIIHNGVDFPDDYFFDQATARQKLLTGAKTDQNQIVIGTIANFYATKGLEYLFEAVKILIIDYRLEILAVIIGDGMLRPQLEKKIIDLDIQNNIFLSGNINDAGKYLKAFDLAIMSSTKEGLPYFLPEAMSASLPIVSTNVGGIPEIIEDNKTGLLVEPKNPKSLAEKIKILIEHPELRKQFGDAGLLKVKIEFNLEKMINETIYLYQK